MTYKRKNSAVYCLLDILCFVVVGVADMILHVANVQPLKRSFRCNDEGIQKPLKTQSITLRILLTGALVTVILIAVCEALKHFVFKCKPRGQNQDDLVLKCGPVAVSPWQKRTLFIIFMYLFGVIVTNLFTDVCKLMVGRLRPNFLAVCKPDFLKLNCSQGYLLKDGVCTGDAKDIFHARLSFPSAHASFSIYSMVFLIMYLETAISIKKIVLFKPFLQITVLSLGVLTSLSRVSDYWHFLSDVIAGMLIGASIAVFVVLKLLRLFSRDAKLCSCHVTETVDNPDVDREDRAQDTSEMVHV